MERSYTEDPTTLVVKGSRRSSVTDLNEYRLESPDSWWGKTCQQCWILFIVASAIGVLLALYTASLIVERYEGHCDVECCANGCCLTCSSCPWHPPKYKSCPSPNSTFIPTIPKRATKQDGLLQEDKL